jgi:hypothetical protein
LQQFQGLVSGDWHGHGVVAKLFEESLCFCVSKERVVPNLGNFDQMI